MAETTQEPIGEPSDAMIATLWAQLQALYALRDANRERALSPNLDLRLRTVALLIASVPATSWSDVLPKVIIAATLRSEGEGEGEVEGETSYQLSMIETAIAHDHHRLQIPLEGDDALH